MKHNATYEQMGRAALIPGMTYMIERMQAELDQMKAALAAIQDGDEPVAKRKYTTRVKSGRTASGWPADPEERSKEMLRRQAVALAKREAEHKHVGGRPSPEGIEKLRKSAKARWAALGPRQRKARIKKLAEARRAATAARLGTVKMEAA